MGLDRLLACLLLAFLPNAVLAQHQGTLHGHVVDSSGVAITNATIFSHQNLLSYPDDLHVIATSDHVGNFSYRVPPGLYDVIVIAPAFEAKTFTITLRAGKSTNILVRLQIAPGLCTQPQIT